MHSKVKKENIGIFAKIIKTFSFIKKLRKIYIFCILYKFGLVIYCIRVKYT